MAIKGSLKEASLPDVVQLLHLGRRTGCLALADRQNFGTIYFDQGKICYATIVNRRDRIGDLLVRSRRITPPQLQQAVEQQALAPDQKLGEILVSLGLITRAELEEHMRAQIEEAVYYLFTWSQGTFNFDAGVRPEAQDFLVQINPEFLLLEGARRVDEWSLIEKKIPSFDLIFAIDRARLDESAPALEPSQQVLLPLLDGTRDVQQLVDASGLGEFEVGKALYGFVTAGYAHRIGTSTAAAPRVRDGRVDEHRNLGVAFYKAGMIDEARREFLQVADLRPDDSSAPFFLGLIALRQARWAEAVAAFKRSLERGGLRLAALHNLGFALEQSGQLDAADAAFAEAVGRAPDDPRAALAWAIVAVKRGQPELARQRLGRAAYLLSGRAVPALWHWASTLAAVGIGEPAEALAAAQAGVAAYPTHPVLQNNLAVLLEFSGDSTAAETVLRSALAEDPSVPQISKNLADILYRNGRYDEAADAYERAAKLAPGLGDDLYFKLGNIAYKRRDQDRARTSWARAVELNPEHQLARANLEMLELPR